jgi:hypothetical protein
LERFREASGKQAFLTGASPKAAPAPATQFEIGRDPVHGEAGATVFVTSDLDVRYFF